ncbi:serine hydrolase domain-containing protein [Kribbella sp. CA-293567]|uniref:serine hydrolase domain-containing protein n=1 Tax=Kribbella sp. CA-293567 TaxID=3002436 RepID=UPI0022DDB741|nr:serine hydrolase domain-containing protein [Kribbella sp. CA-293567]WBQ04715.1 serine hydrolase [Kribbella sp. CA-293567]
MSLSAGIAVLVAFAVVLGGWLVRPRTLEPEPERTGDSKLQAYVDQHYNEPGHRLEVAVISDNSMTFAGRGANEHSLFEIGSVSKAITGLLLTDSVRRGEVRLDQQVGSILPLGDAEVASATLEELATHYSGLPRTSTRPQDVARSLLVSLSAGNPYPYDVDDLINQAKADAGGRGEPAYSNLGGALLGQALASKAGLSYADLLSQRLLQPLEMRETRVPKTADEAAPDGYSSGGRRQAPWIQPGYAPAGGIVSSAGDLALLVQSRLRGIGAEALAPRRDFKDGEGEDSDRIGLFWFTSKLPGTDRSMVWHNGGTGGYRSFVGLDLDRKRAVIVLSDVAADVDDFATELLAAS